MTAVLTARWTKPPFKHQLKEFELYADADARALAWSMRTGKSKEVIDKACHLYEVRNRIDAVLIFAPNGVHENWTEAEFVKHAWPGIKLDALCWRSAQLSAARRAKLGRAALATFEARRAEWWKTLRKAKHSPNLMVLAIPTESMIRPDVRRVVAYLIAKRRVMVVFDESDDLGVPGSKRTKMARALARRCKVRMILSGTMTTGSPLAAFTQFELLQKGALGFKDFGAFKDHFCDVELHRTTGGRRFPKIVGFKNMDELQARMAPFMSVVLREDVKDMPALNFEERLIVPTAEQLRIYRELHESTIVDIDGGRVSINELASRIQKLQQVFSGFLTDEYKVRHAIPGPNPRLDMLIREVYRAPGKVVIWCEFQEDINNVRAALALEGFGFAEYHGRVADHAKPESLRKFIGDKAVKALIGQPQSIGRGRDLSVASTIIWYSHTFKARLRQQAKERATAVGGGNIAVLDFVAPGADRYILKVTEGRVRLADQLSGAGMKTLIEGLAL